MYSVYKTIQKFAVNIHCCLFTIKIMSIILVFATFWITVTANESYEGYEVLKLYPSNEHQFRLIGNIRQNVSIDFLSQTADAGMTVMVDSDTGRFLTKILDDTRMRYALITANASSVIQQGPSPSSRAEGKKIKFSKYNRYATIQNYLYELSRTYPKLVKLEDIGKSFEGRNITMLKIGVGDKKKPTILVDAGIHAREWISPAFAMYLIRELIENRENEDMINNIDWFIIPLLNPDGYEYSHTKGRLWRKTRSRGKKDRGVDANRNFGFHWNEVGASNRERDPNYAGPTAFSESETRALRDMVLKHPKRIKLYLTFHSAGRYLLYPWGYTASLPSNADELHSLGKKVASAIASVSGTKYTVGSSTNVLYPAAGGSDDWVKGVGGVPLSYTIELPEGGLFGFDLPSSRIKGVCVETFKGVKVFHNYVEKKYKKRS